MGSFVYSQEQHISTHTGTIHWFSRLKGIGQIRPDTGGYDIMANISDFVETQPAGSLEHKMVSYKLAKSEFGGQARQINLVRSV
ncbi:cold shock domain-containing protein [Duganella sp. FT50W]|uniref:Cold shock domain-containing protein n=1 Tax=Duganella lactea TaxID=2692173 RepID=A0A6L8MHD6_9BURK|nr:cold shock domain-containing protein [Duganella lactea]MYM81146.1 cold shock domain-containing protein [Duganella lactea]